MQGQKQKKPETALLGTNETREEFIAALSRHCTLTVEYGRLLFYLFYFII